MGLTILYVGSLDERGTCFHRMQAARSLGHQILPLDMDGRSPLFPRWLAAGIAKADHRAANWRLDLTRLNRRLEHMVSRLAHADVVWFDKPLTIRLAALRRIRARMPGAVLATYSPDDQMNPANHSRLYLRCLPHYDIVFTTKSFNVPELTAVGARDVRLIGVGFDPATHRPVELTAEERGEYGCQVSFIGTYEGQRAHWLSRLAADPLELKVWGNGWQERKLSGPLAKAVQGRAVNGGDYPRAVCASQINLAFLRKAMRDQVTTRSVEIPACGGFMLAERTREHMDYFDEDKEAAFFSTFEEMREKIHYYLQHPKARQAIARAGRRRCLESGYSNQDRMRQMLAEVERVRQKLSRQPGEPAEGIGAGRRSAGG